MSGRGGGLISVIVVTKGAKDYLSRCLRSLHAQTLPPAEVIVIDNSLDAGFSQKIKNDFPQVKIYSAPMNLFYAASLNKGISISRGEFILCLNDDICLDMNFINKARAGFFVNDRVGMVSGKVLRDSIAAIDSAGLSPDIFRRAKERGYGRPDGRPFGKECYIFGPGGAAAFYRREMLEDIRVCRWYFDEDLIMFYEDLDIAWRAKNYGWKGYYIPSAVAYHARGGSFRPDAGLNKPFARRYLDSKAHAWLIRNRYAVMLKNESVLGLILHIAPVMLFGLLELAYALFRNPGAIGILSDIHWMSAALAKRRGCFPAAGPN
ncbi:MAG: glycosyltransferase family 2 protein [Candidatus Omnitrophota bacterium]